MPPHREACPAATKLTNIQGSLKNLRQLSPQLHKPEKTRSVV